MAGRRSLLAVAQVAFAGALACGCQTSPISQKPESAPPSFGLNYVPRQSEPPFDEASRPRRPLGPPVPDDEKAEEQQPGRANLLSRLIPGQDKSSAPRKALPVSETRPLDDEEDLDL
jgi:hypothetical protein